METAEFIEAVQDETQTELSRLGSSKALYATTAGQMDEAEVLAAAADGELAANETFERWAASEPDTAVGSLFEELAAEEANHYRAVVDLLDGEHDRDVDLPALHRYLRGLDDSIERVGGFIGRTMASERTKDQVVGFFIGAANTQAASTFRSFGEDLDGQLERALDVLDGLCETEEDWERARHSAVRAITEAYGEYVEALEAMGVNPKPVC